MDDYIIGGWAQELHERAPEGFSRTMYGMITNLAGLSSGTPEQPGWRVASTPAPKGVGKSLWTYGGGECTPAAMPADTGGVQAIVDATRAGGWAGVDFDDECAMATGRLVETMQALRPLESSYTFLAGWAYNNPSASREGQAINRAVAAVAAGGACDRFILMCYAEAMWSMADIHANVAPAIERTLDHVGDPGRVILALTPHGLTAESRDYFLSQVTGHGIGGLFVWDFPRLLADDLAAIREALGV